MTSNGPGESPVYSPGGGGGGGGSTQPGGSGDPGQIEMIYTPATVPTTNVIRFILFVPAHGGNPGKTLLRALTGGTIAKLEVYYQAGGKLELKGFNAGGGNIFDSGNIAFGVDGTTVMVSVELVNSGANVAWTFKAIKPGASAIITTSTGTAAVASVGNVSEVIVAPNADITKTAMGHISVQYALIDLVKVSQALNGFTSELTVDRFIRLANEQALANAPQFSEATDHFGFETSTQGWLSKNGSLGRSTVWNSDGSWSLLFTATAEGLPECFSPVGSPSVMLPVNPGDRVSVSTDIFCPVALSGQLFPYIGWYQADGATNISFSNGSNFTPVAGANLTLSMVAIAPAAAAYFNVAWKDNANEPRGTLIYTDNVRISPRMGTQTRKEYNAFLKEIRELDQGIMKEAKDSFGLKYKTRIALFTSTPAITLDYSQAHLFGQLQPVLDDKNTKNDITVHRHKGSKVEVTLANGAMSVQEPPAGTGRYKKLLTALAEADEQLVNLANHLLTLGTVTDERYPVIEVKLARSEVANFMSVLAAIEMGDLVQIINLPFWYPSTVTNQLVIGYTETLSAFEWDIQWNCAPASPYSVSAISWW
jgi:hypothetical protein